MFLYFGTIRDYIGFWFLEEGMKRVCEKGDGECVAGDDSLDGLSHGTARDFVTDMRDGMVASR